MLTFVRGVIREVIHDPRTPDECLEALERLSRVVLPAGLTSVDREWLGLWLEELTTMASASSRFREAFHR